MICNAGHESRAFSEGEILPRRCPVCNQPYDRRYNRPVLCYQDGSVPKNQSFTDTVLTNEGDSGDIINGRKTKREPMEEDLGSQNGIPRRGRGKPVAFEKDYSLHKVERGRQRIIEDDLDDKTIDSTCQESRNTEQSDRNSRTGLYNGGDCIVIPGEGCYLGREAYGQEYLCMNPLISRRHAYIKIDRFGKVQIKDENSLNGTYVDDGTGRRKLKPHEMVELKIGDTIWLANHILAIEEIQ